VRTVSAFVAKELAEVARQPKLLLLMVLGPFAVMIAFAAGYRNERLVLTTIFVTPDEGIVADTVDQYAEDLSEFIDYRGHTSNPIEAGQMLKDGRVDAIVQLPADPLATVLSGEQAEVVVIHDKLDPIQQTAIEFAARLAVDRLNAEVVESALGAGLDRSGPLIEALDESDAVQAELMAAVDAADPDAVRAAAGSIAELSNGMRNTLALVDQVELASLDPSGAGQLDEAVDRLRDVATTADRVAEDAESDPAALRRETGHIAEQTAAVREALGEVAQVEPAVLAQPFVSETVTTAPHDVAVVDFFAPAVLVLLLQHTGLSLAALSFVRDRSLGLFEAYRVGPQTAWGMLIGKVVSFVLVGSAVAVPLTLLITAGIGAPVEGSLAWLAASLALVVVASVALGLLLSLIAPSDTQAVQYAMLVLLASLFFGGVFLDLERLRLPVEIISWILPVTYGIRLLQDVMLRGVAPSSGDVAGVAALALVSLVLCGLVLHRRLSVSR
jgi:ABC-2 type transport system permease protein